MFLEPFSGQCKLCGLLWFWLRCQAWTAGPTVPCVGWDSSSGPCTSQCELEDSKRLAVVRQWVVLAESLRDHSEVLQSVPHLHSDSLNFLFEDRSASTLLRHLNAWKRWSEFCKSLKLDPCENSLGRVYNWILRF